MIMYRCGDCGNLFEEGEEKVRDEYRGECWGAPAYERICGCPLCGGDYEEVEPCKICGSYEGVEEGEEYCKGCIADAVKRFRRIMEEEFTPEERELLNEVYAYDKF